MEIITLSLTDMKCVMIVRMNMTIGMGIMEMINEQVDKIAEILDLMLDEIKDNRRDIDDSSDGSSFYIKHIEKKIRELQND